MLVQGDGDDALRATAALWWACTDAAYGGSGATVAVDVRDGVVQCGMPAWSVAVAV